MPVIDLADRTPAQRQGLLSQLVVPRPIALISTVSADGAVNVAPFSYYMPVCGDPPTIAVTVGSRREATAAPKDTWVNISDGGELVVNVATAPLAEHLETVAREYPAGVNEAGVVGWRLRPSHRVVPPSLADSPAQLECRVREVISRGAADEPFAGVHIVLAEVVCVSVDDELLAGPDRIDPTRLPAVGRLGFPWFVVAHDTAMISLDRIPYDPAEGIPAGGIRAAGSPAPEI
jgi:flavin reductase (DIM6/NTAB) family NADH-FMN oxidoreductase RutF